MCTPALSLPEDTDFSRHPWSPPEARTLPWHSACSCFSAHKFLHSLLRCQRLSAGQVKSIPAIPPSFIQAEFQVLMNLKPLFLHYRPAKYSDCAPPPLSLVLCRLGVPFSFFPRRLNFASRSCLLLFLVFLVSTQTSAVAFFPAPSITPFLHRLYLDL